ncbi:hypothetical protein, partial [Bacillus thuringiensis]|uniref:hypothetical protein n=1 Tax=Bacillus thuringiensis TaxID=1428 RepID=UPI0021AA7C00
MRLVTESVAEFREQDSSQHVVIVVQHPEADVESAGLAVARVLALLSAAQDADVIGAECEVRTAILSTVIT